jgi:pimeloyl-ACP methyl ester carboxylesterase
MRWTSMKLASAAAISLLACNDRERVPIERDAPIAPSAPAAPAATGAARMPSAPVTVPAPTTPPPPVTMPAPTATPAPATMPPPAAMAGASAPPPTAEPTRKRATNPLIPALRGECPQLVTGSATLMGLRVEILAGDPGVTPGPLLFAWHGTGSSGTGALNMLPAAVKQEITASGGLILAPTDDATVREGAEIPPGFGIWYEGDFAVADELVACAVEHHNIDPRRIYLTGCSTGGLFAAVMALQRSDYVAAVALNDGGNPEPDRWTVQDPTRVPAALTMHGATEMLIDFAPLSRAFNDAIHEAGGFAVNCAHGGRHCGAGPELQAQAWRFLMAHPYGVSPFPYAAGLPDDFPELCRIR